MGSAIEAATRTALGGAAIALAVIVAGCGSGGESASGFAAGDQEMIERTLRDVQLGFAAGDGRAVCRELTATGFYELARLRGGTPGACARVIAEIGRRRRKERTRSKVSELVSADIDGDRASALLRDRGGEKTYRVSFIRDKAGSWKLTSLVLLDAEAIDNPPYGPTPPFDEPPRYIPEEDLYDIQTDFARGRGESVCDDLTPGGRREVRRYGRPGENCADAVRTIKDRLVAGGYQLRSSRLLSVTIAGDRATLLVKDPGRPRYRVPSVRGPGDWKLTSLRHAEPIELSRP
jgi:hypothetical protein